MPTHTIEVLCIRSMLQWSRTDMYSTVVAGPPMPGKSETAPPSSMMLSPSRTCHRTVRAGRPIRGTGWSKTGINLHERSEREDISTGPSSAVGAIQERTEELRHRRGRCAQTLFYEPLMADVEIMCVTFLVWISYFLVDKQKSQRCISKSNRFEPR